MVNILLTGSEGNIGKKIKELLKKDHEVIEMDIKGSPSVDATDEFQVRNFLKGKKVEIIINCIGIPDSLPLKAENILDIDTSYFKKMIDINLNSVFIVIKEVYRECKSTLRNVINISSFYSIVSPRTDLYEGKIKNPAYTASKHGLVGLTKHMAAVLGKDKIRVNCISPGAVVDTIADNKFLEKYKKHVPLETAITILDIFNSIKYLLDTNNVNGHNLILDAGYTCL